MPAGSRILTPGMTTARPFSVESDVATRALVEEYGLELSTFLFDIHPADEMFEGALISCLDQPTLARTSYFNAGWQLFHVVRQIAQWRFGGLDRVASFLDFACGYGRFARFLVSSLAPDRVWVSDIYDGAVRDLEARLGVHGVMSAVDPGEFRIDQRFDLVFVASLFSHLPDARFRAWLRRLHALVTPQGLLVFSVLGDSVLPAGSSMSASGLMFGRASESNSLSTSDYGVTYVTDAYVRAAIASACGSGVSVRRVPRCLGFLQDLYVVGRGPQEAFDVAAIGPGVHGCLDDLTVLDERRLRLRGWAADFTTGRPVTQVTCHIVGDRRHRSACDRDRMDVASHFGVESMRHCGFDAEYALSRPIDPARDVLIVATESTGGVRRVVHASTIAETREYGRLVPFAARAQERQADVLRRHLHSKAAYGVRRTLDTLTYHYQRGGVAAVTAGMQRYSRRQIGRWRRHWATRSG